MADDYGKDIASGAAQTGGQLALSGAILGASVAGPAAPLGAAIGAAAGLVVGGILGGVQAAKAHKEQKKLQEEQEKLAYTTMRSDTRRGVQQAGTQSTALADAYARAKSPKEYRMTTAAPGVSSYDAYKFRNYGG